MRDRSMVQRIAVLPAHARRRGHGHARALVLALSLVVALLAFAPPLRAAESRDLVVVAPELAKVEYEDARVRVVRLRIPAQGFVPMHDRPRRVVVSLTANDVRLTRADGTSSITRTQAGTVAWSEPTVRTVANLGGPLENVVIELKEAPEPAKAVSGPQGVAGGAAAGAAAGAAGGASAGAAGGASAVAAGGASALAGGAAAAQSGTSAAQSGTSAAAARYLDDPVHRWVFENQYVRVYDVRIPPGETTTFHRHAYDQVAVYVSGGKVAVQLEGQPWRQPATLEPRSVAFSADAAKPFTHRVRNDAASEYHTILVQFLR